MAAGGVDPAYKRAGNIAERLGNHLRPNWTIPSGRSTTKFGLWPKLTRSSETLSSLAELRADRGCGLVSHQLRSFGVEVHSILIEIAVLHHERVLIIDSNMRVSMKESAMALRESMRSLVAPLNAWGCTRVVVAQMSALLL